MVFFHLLTEGRCAARLAGETTPVEASAGDLLLFAHDHLHVLVSDVTLPAIVSADPVVPDPSEQLVQIHFGGGGAATKFVCGYVACDRRMARPLLCALPAMLRVPLGDIALDGWLADLMRLGVRESAAQRPGAGSLLSRLSELVFVEALRRVSQSAATNGKGWLAGLRDPHIGRALALVHEEPARWRTVDALAREVGLSRSIFAEKFGELIGEPPMQYSKRWRLSLAARDLREGSEPIVRIAERRGYDSEAAFTRAFKQEFGVPPNAWRQTAEPRSRARGPRAFGPRALEDRTRIAATSGRAASQRMNVRGGQRLSSESPMMTALHFLYDHPGHGPHRLAFDGDHGIGQPRDHVLLLLFVEHTFDELHIDERHDDSILLAAGRARDERHCSNAPHFRIETVGGE
jgi:AraC-like DNA-binding protein